jgi:hypothetical protein
MKQLLLLWFALISLSCTRSETPSPLLPDNPPLEFVPIWKADTLMNNYRVSATDTMIAFNSNDTTGVVYNGSTLYVFGYNFDTTKLAVFNTVWIGATPFDSTTALSKCNVGFYRSFSVGDNTHKYQQQYLTIQTRYPNFATTGTNIYFGR